MTNRLNKSLGLDQWPSGRASPALGLLKVIQIVLMFGTIHIWYYIHLDVPWKRIALSTSLPGLLIWVFKMFLVLSSFLIWVMFYLFVCFCVFMLYMSCTKESIAFFWQTECLTLVSFGNFKSKWRKGKVACSVLLFTSYVTFHIRCHIAIAVIRIVFFSLMLPGSFYLVIWLKREFFMILQWF